MVKLKDVGKLRPGLKVVYSGDTEFCDNLTKISKNADILIHDATFIEEKESRMHSGANSAARTAKKAGVKKLVLTHFPVQGGLCSPRRVGIDSIHQEEGDKASIDQTSDAFRTLSFQHMDLR